MIDNTKEYIACAAIHYDNGKHYSFMNVYNIKSGFVLCGFRHPFIMTILPTNIYSKHMDESISNELVIEYSKGMVDHNGNPMPSATQNPKITQGFMTSLGRFVDRTEAAKLAIECGQLDYINHEYDSDKLYSEDIFPLQSIRAEI